MSSIRQSQLLILSLMFLVTACASNSGNSGFNDTGATADTVWVDVRTDAEYQADHIMGDRHIPLQSISVDEIASQLNVDRDADIRLYCASGVRAGRAQAMLEEAGFTNVSNAGGISNVREARELEH